MVSIHISHLIGQMRGTSHESEAPWVGYVRGTDQREANQLNIIMVRQKHNKVQLQEAPKSYPQAPLDLPELIVQLKQDPQNKVFPRFQASHGRLGT